VAGIRQYQLNLTEKVLHPLPLIAVDTLRIISIDIPSS
jgi:hypothetical protein